MNYTSTVTNNNNAIVKKNIMHQTDTFIKYFHNFTKQRTYSIMNFYYSDQSKQYTEMVYQVNSNEIL